jgi:pSer/pThr/pTyr-binding forkhead associated (FHA) protein
MNQQTLVPRPGERPPLGVLLLDDGAVFQLDTDYVVGREPGLDSSVAGGRARPLRIADDSGIVSRVHASVRLDGWRVLVTDLSSANGTKVQLPGQQEGQILAPQVPVLLATGSQVDLGGRSFRYESHRGH